jgi:hypothetical protein
VGGFLSPSARIKSKGKITGQRRPMVFHPPAETIFSFDPVPNGQGSFNPSFHLLPGTPGLSGDMGNFETLFIHAQNKRQHAYRCSDNRQKRMGQNGKGFVRTKSVKTAVPLNMNRLIIKTVPAIESPFDKILPVPAMGAANRQIRLFSCNF